MDGDLGGPEGLSPQILGGDGTAHASVPPIFREAVLLHACESTNWLRKKKKGVMEEFVVLK